MLGTLVLGLLAGYRRCAHITALRGGAVAAQALGMNKAISEGALRPALERLDEAASAAWMRPAPMHSVREAPDRAWVLDIDARIKPRYGRQEGAQWGYKPARPASREWPHRCPGTSEPAPVRQRLPPWGVQTRRAS